MGPAAVLSVPMLRDGRFAIGAISSRRTEASPFTDAQVALLQTFADQAVIAIENVRLFKELEARTGDLSRSVDRLTALGEVGQAVSSSLDLEHGPDDHRRRAPSSSRASTGASIYEYDEAGRVRAPHDANADEDWSGDARDAAAQGRGRGRAVRGRPSSRPQFADVARRGRLRGSLRER